MSSELKLEAETGRDHGSRSARRLRRSDKIPAILYGQGSDLTQSSPSTLMEPTT